MSRSNRKSSHRSAQSGQAIVLIAFGMVALLAFGALAIDGGNFYNQRRLTQNASDVSSLAGLHMAFVKHGTNSQVLAEMYRVAGDNTIVNASSVTHAWWVDASGNFVDPDGTIHNGSALVDPMSNPSTYKEIPNDSGLMPGTAIGIRVRIAWNAASMIGGVIGRKDMAVQADGVALQDTIPWHDPNPNPIPPGTTSGFFPGNNCGSTPALYIGDNGNSNNFDFGGGNAYINGIGGLGSGNSNQGLFKSGTGTAYFSGSSGTMTSGKNGTISPNWSNPYGSNSYPSQFWYQSATSPNHLIEAEDFRPTTDNSVSTTNYVYRDWYNTVYAPAVAAATAAHQTPPQPYMHAVGPDNSPSVSFATVKSNSAAANRALLYALMPSAGTGLYFVDGDVNVDTTQTGDYGVVATGKVNFTAGSASSQEGYASGEWGFGLSVLAGEYPPSGTSPCGVDAFLSNGNPNPAFSPVFSTTGAQQSSWAGIIYAPNGLVDLSGNFNNGHSLGPIYANALSTANSANANNQNFGPCAACFQGTHPPTYAYSLTQ